MTLEIKSLKFECRPDTSDDKSVREILEKREYLRRDFSPGPGETWADLGGYIGAFGIWAASKGANVKAYEPYLPSYEIYKKNIQLNGMESKIALWPFAATALREVCDLQVHARGNYWRNSLVHTTCSEESVRVDCIPINEAVAGCECVKMDIEGAEFIVLEDMDWLKPVKKFVYEHSFDINPSFKTYEDIVSRLRGIFDVVHARNLPKKYSEWQKSWFPSGVTTFAYKRS